MSQAVHIFQQTAGDVVWGYKFFSRKGDLFVGLAERPREMFVRGAWYSIKPEEVKSFKCVETITVGDLIFNPRQATNPEILWEEISEDWVRNPRFKEGSDLTHYLVTRIHETHLGVRLELLSLACSKRCGTLLQGYESWKTVSEQ